MNRNWVLNASPLILLGKADLLKTIGPLAQVWIIPEGVVLEIEIKNPIESYLPEASSDFKVRREKVSKIDAAIASWDLGQGESEVLTLALRKPGTGVVLDDLQARKCATVLDVPLIGTLGLILLAKRRGLLNLAKPAIDQLIDVGLHIDPVMVSSILVEIGESGK
ncbi:MAG: DUF3368 domain-containing protein [Deltaproteobacteria bacterium]|nr:DUF3368 domain-containing protein [Deltaproteobacteria bacterium]MBW1717716.1 DUF3368 domain-containing protein [Deltaproteobacteria bacterium]MBW2034535.1 DUF3368 domain-containing protein [Deltaproteobacteria bacterium]MBW2116061.1 DUF3368 domain-containing protein [Deltaproteobacteria bacterium]